MQMIMNEGIYVGDGAGLGLGGKRGVLLGIRLGAADRSARVKVEQD